MPSRLKPRDVRAILLRLCALVAVAAGSWVLFESPLWTILLAGLYLAFTLTRPRTRQLWRRAVGRPPRMSYFIE